ncbi:MAG: 30S ribosomal protein S8 [Candidatus Roizmanbacteria bacterium]|nr:MAG: 30S ribosomal protein S8 [Candidatus Roizmanbacteria bacterium]
MSNPITDLMIRIKNGYMAGRQTIDVPYSVFKENVIKKLIEMKYLKGYRVTGDKVKKMTIDLLYKDSEPALTDVKIYSKPGRRWYVSVKDIKPVLGGLGYSLISTPQGVMNNIEARNKKLGGELLFSFW